ncbi:MAG: hypothetical protein WBM68_14280 [Woeseia sp.]
MFRTARLLQILALCTFPFLAACSQDAKTNVYTDEDGPLRYVSADTPYLLASLTPLPDDVYDKLEPRIDRLMKSYQAIIRLSVQQGMQQAAEGEALPEAQREQMNGVIDRLVGLMSADGMHAAGFDRNAKVLLYGNGLLPVLRVSLNDAAAFEKTLKSIEEEAGNEMELATLDKLSYRFVGDDKARVVLAIIDGQLVASIVPVGLSDDSLRSVFGLTLPAQAISKSGRLQQLAETYGYTSHGAGFIDFEKLVHTFTDAQSGINAELLQLGEFDAAQLSDVCKAEIRSMATIAPRLVTGYTEISEERMSSKTVLEFRRDIADGLATLPAVVPGLGTDHGGLVSFGMSIDLLAAREFYSARLDAMEDDPYNCELFAELQGNVAQGRAAMNQPIPPIVYGLKGFLAVIDNVEGLDVATKQPPTAIDMRFLLATENAPGLLAMGSMFSPELAMLNLKNDGKPQRFESPQMQGPIDEAWLAMNDNAIALAVGNGAEDEVGGMLTAATSSPAPFMAMHMDASRYYSFVGDAMSLQDKEDMSPELGAAVRELMQSLAALIDRVSVTLNFTDRGMEMPAVTTLKD